MRIPLVDLKAQYESIKSEIDVAISTVVEESAFIGGPHVSRFENEFAGFCGTHHCVGVGNGTDALFIALTALGIGPGDEVITAANSFIATSEAITATGAKVVFADVDPNTQNIDVADVKAKTTAKTRALLPVHLYGQPADMDPILELARENNLRVVEDAAQAHGAVYKGRTIGSIGDVGCFSFYPGKNLGAYGDGGAIVTDDEELASRARMFANHGRKHKYDHQIEGVNSRLDGLQAAILSVKLRHLPEWTRNRQRAAGWYSERLRDTEGIVVPHVIDDVSHVYHLYVVRVNASIRDTVHGHLKQAGIGAGIHYPIALPNLEAYRYLGHQESDFPVSTQASREVISLPLFPEITEEQVDYVAGKLEAAISA
jgi:dTDP-4-amino-4,6-dideoxygalactose transaminase